MADSASNYKSKILEALISEFEEGGADINRMGPGDLVLTKDICNQKDLIVFIHDFARIAPHFINEFGKEYFGFESTDLSNEGFNLFAKFVHPDDLTQIHNTINFYTENPKATNQLAYRGRHQSGEMRWLFSQDRVLNFTEKGQPQYFIAVSVDLEEMLSRSIHQDNKLKYSSEKRARYDSLTTREKEILILIVQEFKSHEIADKLCIETSTVDTHRKHIIKKLEVRGSLGLVQYSLLFSGTN